MWGDRLCAQPPRDSLQGHCTRQATAGCSSGLECRTSYQLVLAALYPSVQSYLLLICCAEVGMLLWYDLCLTRQLRHAAQRMIGAATAVIYAEDRCQKNTGKILEAAVRR